MIAYNFRSTSSNEAGGTAREGWRKLSPCWPAKLTVSSQLTYRAALPGGGEQLLLDRLYAAMQGAFSRALIADYYISLKTNPFVVLTGVEGAGKAALVQSFADALVGVDNPQCVVIPGSTWAYGTGESNFYRSLHERFGSLRFLEALHEATEPDNLGKLYLVCLKSLHPDELNYYFTQLFRVTPDGVKRLALPGLDHEHQPIIPPNLLITATLNVPNSDYQLDAKVLGHAGLIEFPADQQRAPVVHHGAPLPTGYQHLMLRSAIHDLEQARRKLHQILGAQVGLLRPSPDLVRLLWHAGVALSTRILNEVTIYVTNSFDAEGIGLIDADNPLRNAQMAFDAQVVQRVLWRLRAMDDQQLRSDVMAYMAAGGWVS